MKTNIQSPVAVLSDRTVYFDYLRVFAAFMVVILHVSNQNFGTDVNGFVWQTFNFFNSIARWGVPVFVMISGALFLDKEIPVRKLYSKYIFKLAASFIVWSVVYALFFHDYTNGLNLVKALISGPFHMWFILMLIGVYICMPIIKMLADNEKTMKYYMLMAFIFAFFIPWVETLAYDFANVWMDALRYDISFMYMDMVTGFVSYFVLGYYLNKTDLNIRQRWLCYLLGMIGFALTIGLNRAAALKTQAPGDYYFDYFNVNVLMESVGVFVWFKYQKYNWSKLNLLVQKLSKYSFGEYLAHILIMDWLNMRFGLNTLSFSPVLSVLGIGGGRCLVFPLPFLRYSIRYRL